MVHIQIQNIPSMETQTSTLILSKGENELLDASLLQYEEEVAYLLVDMRQKMDSLSTSIPPTTSSYYAPERTDFAFGTSDRKRKYQSSSSSENEEESFDNFGQENEADWEQNEDEYLEEEEWTESRGNFNSAAFHSPSSKGSSRRKAASGTACEKHKRWKKRCPDDCPMRKQQKNKQKKLPRTETSIEVPSVVAAAESSDDASVLTMIRWSLNQLSSGENSSSSVTYDDIKALEVQITKMRSPSPDSEDYGCGHASDEANEEQLGKKRAIRTSPSTQASSSMSEELKAPKPKRATRLPKILEEEEESFDAPYSPRAITKKQKTSNKRTAGRKYLPSACDRHKLLHAKCPANCPDRIKRDSDMAGKPEDLAFPHFSQLLVQ